MTPPTIHLMGGGPGAVVKAACPASQISRVWHSCFKEANVSSPFTGKD